MAADKEPRLGDVAERAGVSVATVSRVLNNRGYLSAATRSRVMAAIDEVGYQPNEVARSLLTRTAGDVSFVTQGGTTITLTAVPAFTVIPIAASRVRATGTTAQVLALY